MVLYCYIITEMTQFATFKKLLQNIGFERDVNIVKSSEQNKKLVV